MSTKPILVGAQELSGQLLKFPAHFRNKCAVLAMRKHSPPFRAVGNVRNFFFFLIKIPGQNPKTRNPEVNIKIKSKTVVD